MPVNYAGDPLLFPDNIELVTGSDTNTPAIQNAAEEGLADRTAQLYQGKPGDLQVPLAVPLAAVGAAWTFQAGTVLWEQVAIPGGDAILFVCTMPVLTRGVGTYKVTGLECRVNGAGGTAGAGAHGANKPATMPQVTLSSRSDQVLTNHGTTVDSSGSAAAYDIPHSIVHTLAPAQAVYWRRTFYVLFEGEAGANAVANALTLYDINLLLEQI